MTEELTFDTRYDYILQLLSLLVHTVFTLERHDRDVKKTFKI